MAAYYIFFVEANPMWLAFGVPIALILLSLLMLAVAPD
jgi:hypothetical protein